MSAHTPGPWMVGGPYPSVSVCVEVDPGDRETPPTWEPVCVVDQRTEGEVNRQALVDAHLIAAAPDLLEALKELVDIVEGHLNDGDRLDSFTLQPAHAAIAKAETVKKAGP